MISSIIQRAAPIAALIILGLAAAGSAPVGTPSAKADARTCFRARDWQGTTAGGPHDLYLRANISDVYHLTMKQECFGAREPGQVRVDSLITGSDELCSPVDFDIRVGPIAGEPPTPCIVTGIEKLTPEQIKALPRKVVP
jgi:hypothetical protein